MASSSVRYVALQNRSFAKVYLDLSKDPPEVIRVSIVSHLDVDENNRDIYDNITINMSSYELYRLSFDESRWSNMSQSRK
jgi:hypothetical protein